MIGRIRDEDIDEVRRRTSLRDVAAEYMQVKRAGGHRFKALCPFHSEKTPSFSLDEAKGMYYCFGCGKGGNVFHLMMELESLSFAEAVERLARKAGVELRYERASAADRKAAGRRERLVDAHRQALAFYRDHLMGPDGADARAYLKGRGIRKDTAEEFGIGLAPARRDDLSRTLLRRGFSEDELIEGGLAMRTEAGPLVDRFRGRLMFPIHDLTGNVVAFGARRLSDRGDGPKYLNSAESPIYKKGSVLYALNRAKQDVVKAGHAVVVEGYTDVIALHQEGVRTAVATCGTALGLEHFKLLRRFTQRTVLAFDSDAAGLAAAERAFEHVQEADVDARVLVLPDGQDPADFVGTKGGDAFAALVERASPLIGYMLEREVARVGADTPELQSRALRAAVVKLAAIRDEVVQVEYARRLAEMIRVPADQVFMALDRARRTGSVPPAAAGPRRLSAQARTEREALKLALQYPREVRELLDGLAPEDFTHPMFRRIFEELRAGADPAALAGRADDPKLRDAVTALSVDPPEGVAPDAPLPPRLAEEIFGRVKEFSLQRQIEDLKQTLQRLNPEKDAEWSTLYRTLFALEGEKRRIGMVLQGGAE